MLEGHLSLKSNQQEVQRKTGRTIMLQKDFKLIECLRSAVSRQVPRDHLPFAGSPIPLRAPRILLPSMI